MTPSPYAAQFNEIANHIEAHKSRFYMPSWLKPGEAITARAGNHDKARAALVDVLTDDAHYCGSAACIGGTAQAIAEAKHMSSASYLPLSRPEEDSLFFALPEYDMHADLALSCSQPVWVKYADELGVDTEDIANGRGMPLSRITADMAITMLRKLATGEWTF